MSNIVDGNIRSLAIEGDADIITTIRKSFKLLSPKLKVVAQYVIDYPHEFALNSLNSVSSTLNIPQSTIVRLAKFFGFNNGQDFQRTISKAIISNFDYSNRIRLGQAGDTSASEQFNSPAGTLKALIQMNIDAMRHMESTLDNGKLQRIVDLIVEAESVYLIGVRRVFPLMLQMRYGLSHFHKKVFIVNGLGGMFREEAENIDKNSLLFTVSYYPYSPEPIDIQKMAIEKNVKNILVTDSELHPLFDQMNEKIIIRDAEFHGVRTLSASMNFVQAVVIAVGACISDNR